MAVSPCPTSTNPALHSSSPLIKSDSTSSMTLTSEEELIPPPFHPPWDTTNSVLPSTAMRTMVSKLPSYWRTTLEEEAGGRWLDSRRTELMDEALLDNLDCLRKQRQWCEKGVAERHAKRQRREDNEAYKPFAPSRPAPPSTNAVAGPSTTTPTHASPKINTPPPPPTSTATVQPAPPNNEDAEMTEGEATRATKRSAREDDEESVTKR
ncbi:hypothetical protein EV702DRAFT_1192072 [Suillus placidus]|uniref:Uncharacterized protein n=1 Tax=Suillus placidus TaxID=48579 RepID=A0A9P7D6T8_9AGAM|nr:hypothetical protein EV702DRAFT_1192072 [Suillus placidus]